MNGAATGSILRALEQENQQSKIAILMKKAFFALYFFFALFMPPVIPIDTKYLVIAFNVAIIGGTMILKGTFKCPKKVFFVLAGFLPFTLYLCCVQMIHAYLDSGNTSLYVSLLKSNFNVLLYLFVMVLAIVQMMNFFDLSIHDIIYYLFLASMLQLFCVVAAFVLPPVKSLFISFIMRNSHDEILKKAVKKGTVYRCFGFANNLFDSLGYIMSLCIAAVFLEGIAQKKLIYIVSGFLLLFISLVNTRTGLLLSAVAFAIIALFYCKPKNILIVGVCLPLIVFVSAKVLSLLPGTTAAWVTKGVEETSKLLSGNVDANSGTYNQILGKDVVFPEQLFLGAGASPESIARYSGIDSGYIQCLWRYGGIGTALLLFGYVNAFVIAFFTTREKHYRCLLVIDAAVFLIYLFKLFSFSNYGSAIVILGIPVFILTHCALENERRQKNWLRYIL